MAKEKTYCFRYRDIDKNLCYIWINAFSLDAAKIKFEDKVNDCFKIVDIRETFYIQE